ncbi:disulfide-isomerase-like protein [Cymbomonas tetramitiformis]|uniref:Disulfide-isomerase-like protein n=1 Tax=Cymbomonas tetramitiformis TaxID=36881 RepID=A0AAE0BVN0_9CHLO|nr:disulfide-isomerase-like protein [Cymbomonas tetramitiformis]
MRAIMLFALFGATSGSTEVKTVKDAIFLTKAKDVVVMGLFESKKSDELKVFKAASKTFPTVAPVDFSYSFSPEVIERYAEETQGRSPAVLVFRRFDEEGKPKRKQYTFAFDGDDFTEEALANFIFKSSIPLVPSVGNVQGEQKMRWQLAMLSRLPKFLFFSAEDAINQDFLECARSQWSRFVEQVTVGPLC